MRRPAPAHEYDRSDKSPWRHLAGWAGACLAAFAFWLVVGYVVKAVVL